MTDPETIDKIEQIPGFRELYTKIQALEEKLENVTTSIEVDEEMDHLSAVDCFRRYTKTVLISTGDALVFENTIPRRFVTIKNETEDVQHRLQYF